MSYETPPLILKILKREIDVTLEYYGGAVLYNINTQAKSELRLELLPDGSYLGHCRYGKIIRDIKDLRDVVNAVRDCMHGRDYVSQAWLDVMVEFGIVRRIEKTVVTYENN